MGILTEIETNKARVLSYKGISFCRCCGIENGSKEFYYKNWCWPSGYKHYLEVHNISPSNDFIKEVLNLY